MTALVLSGGASRGAFQVGVLQASGKDRYDHIYGCSVGALNGAILAQYPTTASGVSALVDLWSRTHTRDVYRPWWPSWLGPLAHVPALWKPALFNAAPLMGFVASEYDPSLLKVPFTTVATDLTSGRVVCADTPGPGEVYASAAFPVAFRPYLTLTDGGVQDVTPVRQAIRDGHTDLDVIMCQPVAQVRPMPSTTLGHAALVLDRMMAGIIESDLTHCSRHANIRVWRPRGPLPGSSLVFDPANAERLITIGLDTPRWQ